MAETTTAPVPRPERRIPAGRVVLTVLGVLLIVTAIGVGVAGLALAVPYAVARDDDGFVHTRTVRLDSATHAISTEEIDLRGGRDSRRDVDLGDLATVRLQVEARDRRPVFVGIGPEADVQRYLAGMAHAEITDIEADPFAVTYRYAGSGAPTAPPGAQTFWAVRASGSGLQTIDWEPERGRWTAVVMNADGGPGVNVDTSAGIKADWIIPLGVGLAAAGIVALLAGVALLVAGVVGIGAHLHPAPATVAGPYPLSLEGRLQPVNRFLWLVKWILVFPHLVVLGLLWTAFAVLTVVAGVAILVTGRYPRPLFDFNLGVLRWTWRVGFYSFAAFGTDHYPPFTLGPAPDYPATLDLAYPARLSRGLVLVKWWLLAIPHYLVVSLITGTTVAVAGDDLRVTLPGLMDWLLLVAVVALLFTARYPRGVFDFVMGLNRWVFRVIAYAALMTDQYPPFRLDQGETEPAPAPAAAPADRPEALP